MNVLVAVASRHGSTLGIGRAIAEELHERGLEVAFRDAAEVADLAAYDAVVLGSAVYMGRWMPAARHFTEVHHAALLTLPLWLFSSGPVGDPPKPPGDPVSLASLATTLGAREHRIFAGRLAPDELGFTDRLVVNAVRASAGDFRDWAAIRAWAAEIAAALGAPAGVADVSATPSDTS